MHKLETHHTLNELNAADRKAKSGRIATRILMIRDVQSGCTIWDAAHQNL
jgi:hypothetical protein